MEPGSSMSLRDAMSHRLGSMVIHKFLVAEICIHEAITHGFAHEQR